jgi:hypothetical protein
MDIEKLRADARKMKDPVVFHRDAATAKLIAQAIGARAAASQHAAEGEAFLFDAGYVFEMKPSPLIFDEQPKPEWVVRHNYGVARPKIPLPITCTTCGRMFDIDPEATFEILATDGQATCPRCRPSLTIQGRGED